MNFLFLGMACLLAAASGYWILGRGTPRPAGTWAMGALLASFAAAFATYSPLVEDAVEAVIPHVARLLSNSASLAAATSVLAVSFQVNLEPDDARRRVRLRLVLLVAAVFGMTTFFTLEQLMHRSSAMYALYLLIFISYLAFAIVDFLRQAVQQANSSRRRSVKVGLRTAALGCVFALIYAGYKLTLLVTLGIGIRLIPDHTQCSSLIAAPCVFSVTSPAFAVLLICLGLTLPAVVYPISQSRRRRWEIRSFEALGPLWQDLSAAMPQIVLPAESVGDANASDSDFLLQRRVVEISDGILALRPYRSQQVQDAAQQTVGEGTDGQAAIVEAAVLAAALAALKAGRLPDKVAAPPTADATGGSDLRADTQWLLRIADAYLSPQPVHVAAGDQPSPAGA